jgi:hypothetical protein
MKRFLMVAILGMLCGVTAARATDPIYANYGLVTTPPQIDATIFLNAGQFDFSTVSTGIGYGANVPFDTQYTLFYTNRGFMTSPIGWRFEYVTDENRSPADWFVNEQDIVAQDSATLSIGSSSSGMYGLSGGSYLSVSATNIVSSGLMAAGSGGLVKIEGQNIDMSNAGLSASDASLSGKGYLYNNIFSRGLEGETNYLNPTEISDLFWGIGVNQVLGGDGSALVVQGQFGAASASSPMFQVIDTSGYTNTAYLPATYYYLATNSLAGGGSGSNYVTTNYYGTAYYYVQAPQLAFFYTNQTTAGSAWIEGVYVTSNAFDTNIDIQVKFQPRMVGTNGGSQVMVEFSSKEEDVVSGTTWTNYLYLVDSTMLETNATLKGNYISPTARPSGFQILRAAPNNWYNGVTSNTAYSTYLFDNPSYSTQVATNSYSAYSIQFGENSVVNNNANETGLNFSYYGNYSNPALTDPTNFSGRVELLGLDAESDPRSDSLDLRNARIRSDGLLTIKTKDLVSTEGTKIDAPLISVDLGSPSRTLMVSNIFSKSVNRMKGTLSVYSALWTNQISSITVSNAAGSTESTVTTNLVDVRFHVMIVDHTLTGSQSVVANDIALRATNIVVADDINLQRGLYVDGQSLTLQGGLQVQNGIGATNLPTVMNFTNNGSLMVPMMFNAGADRNPFESVVNHGTLSAGGYAVRAGTWIAESASAFSYGDLYATNINYTNLSYISAYSGAVKVEAGTARINNALVVAQTDVSISASDFYAANSYLSAGSTVMNSLGGESTLAGVLSINASNSVYDGGLAASNYWRVIGSAQMLTKPVHGDLLGTTIETIAPKLSVVRHVWAGEDMGLATAGFTNNGALGAMILDAKVGSHIRFAGSGTNKALYVDYLEFRNYATNFASVLDIDPSITVYFANANLPVKKLDGKFNGHLRWIQQYAGNFSGTDWASPITGATYRVNTALLNSTEIDSDGDGVVNALDSTPFYFGENVGLNLAPASSGSKGVTITWNALANATNCIDLLTNYTVFEGVYSSSNAVDAHWEVTTNAANDIVNTYYAYGTNEFTTNYSVAPNWRVYTNFVQGPLTESVTVQLPVESENLRLYRVRVVKP